MTGFRRPGASPASILRRMITAQNRAALSLAALLLAGCGLKGPLYLPERPAETSAAARSGESSATTRKRNGSNAPERPQATEDEEAGELESASRSEASAEPRRE